MSGESEMISNKYLVLAKFKILSRPIHFQHFNFGSDNF